MNWLDIQKKILQKKNKNIKKECIPVGCVPSAVVAFGGGGVSQHALGRNGVSQHALGGGCPSTGQGGSLPRGDCVYPGGCVCPEGSAQGVGCLPRGLSAIPPHPLWTEWQMLVKTLPSHKFVGGKHKITTIFSLGENVMLSFTYVMCQKILSERGNKGGIKISGVRSAILWSLLMSSSLSKTGNRKYFGMKMFHRYKARLIFFSIFLWLLFLHLRISWKILRAVLSFRAGFFVRGFSVCGLCFHFYSSFWNALRWKEDKRISPYLCQGRMWKNMIFMGSCGTF